jgi:hypothetical protein
MNPSASRLALIEETAMLQNDTPPEDFAVHYYLNRYDRLKGIVKRDFADLSHSIHTALDESFGRNSGAFPSLMEQNPVAWSMNWYRLRDNNNKTWMLDGSQKTAIVADFVDMRLDYPFDAEIHIFQLDDRDVLLVAMCLQLRQG